MNIQCKSLLVVLLMVQFCAAAPVESIIRGAPTPKIGDLWVSTDGNDSNSGTQDNPLKTLPAAIEKVKAGNTIWMTAGVHKYSDTVFIGRRMHGTAAEPYRISGIPGGPRPKLDFNGVNRSSEIRGIQLDGNYWHLYYLEIFGASDNNVNVNGSHNLLEMLVIHSGGDTGLQINSTNSLLPSYNRILNCDSFMNADKSAEDADGFAAKLIVGPGNLFEGCRAWYNCDDNWDLYDAQAVVTFKGCWSITAKHPTGSKRNSDGNGFKLGGVRRENSSWNKRNKFSTYDEYLAANANPHYLEECYSFGNPARGFHRNNNPSTEITCKDCGGWDNVMGDFGEGIKVVGERRSYPSVTAEKAIAAQRDANGNLPDIRTLVDDVKQLVTDPVRGAGNRLAGTADKGVSLDSLLMQYAPKDEAKANKLKRYFANELGEVTYGTEGTGTARTISKTIVVLPNVVYDGKGEVLTADAGMGSGSQDEHQKPLFLLAPGAEIRNVTITAPGCEGIHMMGDNVLDNIHWQDVGEDAASVRTYFPGGKITIKNCKAYKASDKVFQFNTPCNVYIENFVGDDMGKLVKIMWFNEDVPFYIDLNNVQVTNARNAIVQSANPKCYARHHNLSYTFVGKLRPERVFRDVSAENVTEY